MRRAVSTDHANTHRADKELQSQAGHIARGKTSMGLARDRIGALRWVPVSFFAVGTKGLRVLYVQPCANLLIWPRPAAEAPSLLHLPLPPALRSAYLANEAAQLVRLQRRWSPGGQ